MSGLGVLIPHNVVGIKSLKSSAKFILVVEKDTIFQKLLDEGILTRLKPCILITVMSFKNTCDFIICIIFFCNIKSLILLFTGKRLS